MDNLEPTVFIIRNLNFLREYKYTLRIYGNNEHTNVIK
jgi:hypothetical protein